MAYRPHPVTLRQLQYILAVAERKSFRKAAEVCHVAQPSLSAQVAQAEQAIGVVLFERRPREIVITQAGNSFVERAKSLLIAADELFQAARGLSDPRVGILRVGVIPTIGPYLLPEVAPAFGRRLPKLTIVWTEDKTQNLLHLLERGELDAAILALESGVEQLAHVEIGRDPFAFAAAPNHPLARARRAIRPEEMQGQRMLLLDDGHCFREQALAFCSTVGVAEANYRATSLSTLVQMVAAGIGVTLLPKLALPTENRRASLAVRSIVGDVAFRTVALVWRRKTATERSIRAVGDVLREVYPDVGRVDQGTK